MDELAREVAAAYPQLGAVESARLVYSSVHDMVEVRAGGDRFALKLYRPGVRTVDDVAWEVALHRHLLANGGPLAELVSGVETIEVDGAPRLAVLSTWAPGAKPPPTEATYRLVGRAAAAIHAAADTFGAADDRPARDLQTELHDQLGLLRPSLEQVGRWDAVADLARRLEDHLSTQPLDVGVCHNDLTLDNVHIEEDRITVFDLDSAALSWRAAEPQGVFHAGQLRGDDRWAAWQAGYREVRPLAAVDAAAVPWFVLLFQLENTAWKLGLTPTSIGPQLGLDDLPTLVDWWGGWWHVHCR
ncbi:MAG TPA: phosphotransferase [Acidimicrobiales bacterium]|nr:phosphotransferase [Acidimicrobiales bacterium]